MKRIGLYLRLSLLVVALALTGVAMAPAPVEAVKSCEYYCGEAGPYTCQFAPGGLVCSTWYST